MLGSFRSDDAAPALRACLEGAGEFCDDGWVIAWWLPVDRWLEAIGVLRNTVPSERGWNAIYVRDRGSLESIVVDVADQASSSVVIDIEACF